MKPWTNSFVLVAILALSGCASAPALVKRQVISEAVTVQPAHTNTVSVGTNIFLTITPPAAVTNYLTNIVYDVNPGLVQTIKAIQGVNEAINPTPSAPIINLVLGGIAAALGLVAKVKSDKAALVPALVAGVEAAGNADVKKTISQVATAAGVEKKLSAVVQDLTS